MSSDHILSLDDPAARDAAVVGEKAAVLARLRQGGLPVPAGFVVAAGAFAEATSGIAPRIDSTLAGARDGMAALERASRTVQDLIGELQPSAELRRSVASAYAALGRGDGVAVAVRSSATAEDLESASFAGQYDSYLNISGPEAVVEQLMAVWASLYSPHAIAYRQQQGVPHAAAKMAVLIQQQLPADAAGVLFTRDPLTGDEDRVVISATPGLGEGVVSGEAPADSFTLDGHSLAVLERHVAEKTTMVTLRPRGGVQQRELPAALRARPTLTDDQLAELGRLARSVRQLEGGHRDIEFAFVDGDPHLLQARPVTGLDTPHDEAEREAEFPVVWEDPADEEHGWALSARGFGRPLPLRRFEEDAQRAYAAGSKRIFDETGSPMAQNHIVRFINGYPYSRAPELDADEVTARQRRHQERDAEYHAQGSSLYAAEIEPVAAEAFHSLNRFNALRRERPPALLAQLEASLEGYGHVMGGLHWAMAGAMRLDWPSVFHELTGEPEVDSGVLLQAIDNKTTRLVRRLRGLARIVQADEQLRALFRDRDYDRLGGPSLRGRPHVRRFRSRFRRLLRDYGMHTGRGFGSSVAFDHPTWNMSPREPLEMIRQYADQDLDDLEHVEAEARRERQRNRSRLRSGLAGDPQRLGRFDEALERSVAQVRRMEDHNYLMEQGVSGSLREALFLLGDALARAGRIDDPDEVLHLSLDELRDAARDGGGDLRPLVRQRHAQFERRSSMEPPHRLGRGPAPPPGRPARPGEEPPAQAGLSGTQLRGLAASRGLYTGRARVASRDHPRPEIERGDILVTRNAGPDWTPVLPLLGGLVLDEGAIFQHAALVAREYRVPCVLQTREGTKVIDDGQRITVDGDAGVVELSPEPLGGSILG